MINRFLPPRVLSFEGEGNFDLSDSKNVQPQSHAQLIEKPVKNEEQWLQQINWRLQVHSLFEVRWKILGDQWVHIRPLRQPPPTESFLSETLDNGNFGKSRKFREGVDAPTAQRLGELEGDAEGFE